LLKGADDVAFSKIDVTTPAATDKVRFGDDKIREFKQQVESNLAAISNYNNAGAVGTVPALKTAVWTTAGRPTGADLVTNVCGYNSDLKYEEFYDGSAWKQKNSMAMASWSVAGRPSSPYTGQYGYNSDLAVIERWSGSAWTRVSGGNRGDKKDWYGDYNQAETLNPGWKLFNGQTFTHPEGGSVTLPDLRDKFIAGAGNTYAVGATGGAATVTLTEAQMPSHNHTITVTSMINNGSDTYVHSGILNSYTSTSARNPIGYTGSGAAHENRPPYYALCYLYKL
jgi:hypothetical protein